MRRSNCSSSWTEVRSNPSSARRFRLPRTNDGARVDRARGHIGKVVRRAVKALVTGGEGGIGRAIRARLEAEGYEVQSLDLMNGFDVTDPGCVAAVGPVDIACLNAGVLPAS